MDWVPFVILQNPMRLPLSHIKTLGSYVASNRWQTAVSIQPYLVHCNVLSMSVRNRNLYLRPEL